jgi:hypothetical protein
VIVIGSFLQNTQALRSRARHNLLARFYSPRRPGVVVTAGSDRPRYSKRYDSLTASQNDFFSGLLEDEHCIR